MNSTLLHSLVLLCIVLYYTSLQHTTIHCTALHLYGYKHKIFFHTGFTFQTFQTNLFPSRVLLFSFKTIIIPPGLLLSFQDYYYFFRTTIIPSVLLFSPLGRVMISEGLIEFDTFYLILPYTRVLSSPGKKTEGSTCNR